MPTAWSSSLKRLTISVAGRPSTSTRWMRTRWMRISSLVSIISEPMMSTRVKHFHLRHTLTHILVRANTIDFVQSKQHSFRWIKHLSWRGHQGRPQGPQDPVGDRLSEVVTRWPFHVKSFRLNVESHTSEPQTPSASEQVGSRGETLRDEEQLPISSPDSDQDPGCAQPW